MVNTSMESETAGPLFYVGIVVQWIVSGVVVIAIAFGVSYGIDYDADTADTEEVNFTDSDYAWKVHAPAVMICMIGIIIAQLASRKVSIDAIEQRSTGVDIKESCKTCWTNTGVVSALALSFNMNNIMSAPEESEAASLPAQWYGAIMLISSIYNVIAIILSVVSLLYIEGLSTEATTKFLKEMPYVLGRPVCFMCLGLTLFFFGLMINILSLYGSVAFSFSICLLLNMMIYVGLEWKWIAEWENKVDNHRTSVLALVPENHDSA